MNKRIGKQTVKLTQPISIISSANIVGKKEGEGPLSQYFDTIMSDATSGTGATRISVDPSNNVASFRNSCSLPNHRLCPM